MIEVLKLIGSALVAAGATLLSLYLKHKWEKQDKRDEKKTALEDKVDKMAEQLTDVMTKVDKLSAEFDKEVNDTDDKNRSLQAGLREILYDRIKFLCRKYTSEGKIREEDYNSIKRMWNVYHTDLGGNGFLNSEMENIDELEKC